MNRLKTASGALALMLCTPGMAWGASEGLAGATSTGTFDATLTVTEPAGLGTVRLVGLEDHPFGSFAKADLVNAGTVSANDYYCLDRTGSGGQLSIKFEQTGVSTFNADIGTNFALVGPARTGTASGNAQIPFKITHLLPFSTIVVVRGTAIATSDSPLTSGACTGATFNTSTTRPSFTVQRLAAADGNNPADPQYSATIQVTIGVTS